MDKYIIKDFERNLPHDACLECLKNNRWSDGIHYVKCQRVTKQYKKITARSAYVCEFCGRYLLMGSGYTGCPGDYG